MKQLIIIFISLLILYSCNITSSDSTKVESKDLTRLDSIDNDTPEITQLHGFNPNLKLDSIYKSKLTEYEVFPEFPGGTDSFNKFVRYHIVIPDMVKGKEIGIAVSLAINSKGKVVKVDFGDTYNCEECKNLIRKLVAQMPLFKPAMIVNKVPNKSRSISMTIDIDILFF